MVFGSCHLLLQNHFDISDLFLMSAVLLPDIHTYIYQPSDLAFGPFLNQSNVKANAL